MRGKVKLAVVAQVRESFSKLLINGKFDAGKVAALLKGELPGS